jgi:hypothetical protein
MISLAQLTDSSLHSELKRLVGSSNTLTAQLLAHLGEVEARGIHRERACSSLYTYCVYELRMSEDEAQRRCRGARLARQFPVLLDMLAEASLHLTGILLIGPHLTAENQSELLARARFRTKREIERLVAEVAPCRDVPSVIEPLHRASAADSVVSRLDDGAAGPLLRPRNSWAAYVRSLAGPLRQMEAGLGAGQAPPRASEAEAAAATMWHAARGAVNDFETRAPTADIGRAAELESGSQTADIGTQAGDRESGSQTADIGTQTDDGETRARTTDFDGRHANAPIPCGESQRSPSAAHAGEWEQTATVPATLQLRYRVQFTADQAYVDLLEEARNLLQHELPRRDLVEVQRRALELLVHKLRQRKYAHSERPRPKAPEPANEAAQPTSAMRDPHSKRPRPDAPEPANEAAQPQPTSAMRDPHSERPRPSAPEPVNEAPQPKSAMRDEPAPEPTRRARPRARHSAPRFAKQGRYISAEVRRSVWQRDDARCTYVDVRGQRCREQGGLEFHHQHPHARGGPPSADNLTLRCRSHNTLAAEQDFGRDIIRQERARKAT